MMNEMDGSSSRPAVAFSERERDWLIRQGDKREAAWHAIARFCERKAGSDIQTMALYAEVGRWVRSKASSVRSWVGMRQLLGDDLIAEFPQLGLSHWRVLRSAARRKPAWRKLDEEHKRALLVTLLGDAASNALTPETLAARLNGSIDRPDPFRRSLLRAAQALESARKRAPDADNADAVRRLGAQLEALMQNMEAEL